MSDYLKKRMQHILDDRPLPEKKMNYIRPVSAKRQAKINAEKQLIMDPNEFFTYHMKHSIPICEECGFEAQWLLDPAYNKLWRACQAHVLPKKKEYGFPSLRDNLENHLVLFPSFGGKLCGCHGFYDSSWYNASTMKIWTKVVGVFIDLYPQIPEREKKSIPEVFLPYVPNKEIKGNLLNLKNTIMPKKKFTWGQLKKFINKLPEKELKKEVNWWGEEKGGSVSGVYQLDEDYVQTDYGCEPASVQEYEKDEDKYPVSFKKGTPIIDVD